MVVMAGKHLFCLAAAIALPLFIAITLRLLIRRTTMCKTRKRLDGMVVMVTGASSGVGRAVAVGCARRGASVVLGCRNLESAGAVLAEIEEEAAKSIGSGVHGTAMVLRLDLASLESVRECVQSFLLHFDRLDILVNNAAYLGPKAASADGHDYCFQVNFLSHFYLTNLLIRHLNSADRLSSDSPLRVINMSSDSYVMGDANFDDVIGANYSIYGMYATTKLAMMMSTAGLVTRYSTRGVKAVAVHPGAVSTGLTRYWPGLFGSLLRFVSPILFRSPSEGAQSVLHCATSEDFDSIEGTLVADCRSIRVDPIARNRITAERLWMLAEQMCGL